jgi:response regulator RpfG family c-di-GMP phosphodiesterase
MSNYLDTRELEERRQELQVLKDELDEAREIYRQEGMSEEDIEKIEAVKERLSDAELEFGHEEAEELKELDALADQISEWKHGETLIPCDKFERYARDFASDIGAIDDSLKWPCTCIDWEEAASELAMDFTEVTYLGTDYYVRS